MQSASNEASATNPGGKARTPIIAGTICGVVIGLAWLIATVWYFMRRRKRQSNVDLINTETKPYNSPPVGYGPSSAGPGWEAQSLMQQNHQPWANDPAFTEAYARSHTNQTYPMSMNPPSSVGGGGSGGPDSPVGSPLAHGVTTSGTIHHQPLATLTHEGETDSRVHEIVPPPNLKGRSPQVQHTGFRGNMTEDELRMSRMQVPDRAQ